MKVYVVNCFVEDEESCRFDIFSQTIGVFIMKHYAEQKIDQLKLYDKENGELCRYTIEVFEL